MDFDDEPTEEERNRLMELPPMFGRNVKKRTPLPTVPTWHSHVERWRDCQLCPLGQQRTRIVLARGSIPCDILFVGEAPGVSEDVKGLPFWGPAGSLLDDIVASALSEHKTLTTAYTNLVACYPRLAKEAGENEPELAEIRACAPRLREFVELCKPKLVVAVGRLVEENLDLALPRDGLLGLIPPQVAITHPAAIMRMPLAQQDMAVRRCVATIRDAVDALAEMVEIRTPEEVKS